jgi:hypothetical protein
MNEYLVQEQMFLYSLNFPDRPLPYVISHTHPLREMAVKEDSPNFPVQMKG